MNFKRIAVKPLKLKTQMMLILGLLALLQTGLIGTYAWVQLNTSLSDQIALRALHVAKTIAAMPEVINAVEQKDTKTLQPLTIYLAEEVDARFIVIGDRNAIRLAHPTPERVGQPMYDDEGDYGEQALIYGKPYTQRAEGSLGASMRGKAPIFDITGEDVIGIISVGFMLNSVEAVITEYRDTLFLVIILIFGLSIVFAALVANHFKRAIFGLEPDQIARAFEEQQATLETIREGVISINAEGEITTFNSSAISTLNLDAEKNLIGKIIDDVLPDSEMVRVLSTGKPEFDREVPLQGRAFVVNRIPLIINNEVSGVVSSFRPKDELDFVSERLTRIEHYADSLRSQSHEYTNKLHTIAGLIQIGASDKALEIIGQESHSHQELIDVLLSAVKDPVLSGCLLGKYNRARELGLNLVVHGESHMTDIPPHIARENLVTILGNLIDNALEANLKTKQDEITNVLVSMSDLGDELIFDVEDVGPGIDESNLSNIFNKGVSSKEETGHGYGLHLVKNLVKQYGGQITIEPTEKTGSRFTVYIPKQAKL